MRSHVRHIPLARVLSRSSSSNKETRIVQVFIDSDLRFSMPGLLALCKKNKIKVEDRGPGNLIVFVNTAKNMIKAIACNGTADPILTTYPIPKGYPRGHKFDLSVISEIPRAFHGGRLDIADAMRQSLLKKMEKTYKFSRHLVATS